MEPEQYEVLQRREDSHWWYRGMRRASMAVLRQALEGAPPPRILDAGCGTGGTTDELRAFGGPVFGLDLMWEALERAATRGLKSHLAQGTIERLPFRDSGFDVVTSFEVVYHAGVAQDRLALAEFRRVLRPGGLLLLRLPAHDWLRGRHDVLVHTRHRYSRVEVREKLLHAGFRIELLSWANSMLFPVAAGKRLMEHITPARSEAEVGDEPDLWQPPAPVNWLLEQCVAVERLALPRRIPLPFGLSVIALARAV